MPSQEGCPSITVVCFDKMERVVITASESCLSVILYPRRFSRVGTRRLPLCLLRLIVVSDRMQRQCRFAATMVYKVSHGLAWSRME